MKALAERLKALRRRAHQTQRDAADRLGVSHSTIALYENGKREPTCEMLIRLAKHYGVSVDWLLGLTPFEPEGETPAQDVRFTGSPLPGTFEVGVLPLYDETPPKDREPAPARYLILPKEVAERADLVIKVDRLSDDGDRDIKSGDFLFVQRRKVSPGDLVSISLEPGLGIGRVVVRNHRRVVETTYPEASQSTLDNANIIGRIVGIYREV